MLKDVFNPKRVNHPPTELLPKGFIFPTAYLEYVNRKEIIELYPWYFMCHSKDFEQYNFWTKILKEQYPSRQLVPFAKWEETSDDLACFEPSDDPNMPSIHWIHAFTDPGYEERGNCATFEEWLKESINDAEEYQTENPDYKDELVDDF